MTLGEQVKIRLIRGTLLIVRDPPETSTRGIVLPDIRHVTACTGKVLMHEPVGLEDMTDAHVVYAKHSEKSFPLGESMFTITEDSVMAVLDSADKAGEVE
jgi:hypothetical protein